MGGRGVGDKGNNGGTGGVGRGEGIRGGNRGGEVAIPLDIPL